MQGKERWGRESGRKWEGLKGPKINAYVRVQQHCSRCPTTLNAYMWVQQVSNLNDADPLMWWKQHLQEFPRLARTVRQHLAVPATSASPEKFFLCVRLALSTTSHKIKPYGLKTKVLRVSPYQLKVSPTTWQVILAWHCRTTNSFGHRGSLISLKIVLCFLLPLTFSVVQSHSLYSLEKCLINHL